MAGLDDLVQLNQRIGRSIPFDTLNRIAISLGEDETALAIAHVSKVMIDGALMESYPMPVGIFDAGPCPVVLLTNRYLRVVLIGTRVISRDLPLVEETLECYSVADVKRAVREGRFNFAVATTDGSEIHFRMGYLSTWKNVRGTARLIESLAGILR
jgi:hypothetical protein